MSLNRGGEERPSRRKAGWEVGTEGAGAGGGPPGRGEQQHSRVSAYYFHTKVSMCYRLRCVGTRYKHHIYTGGYNAGLYCNCVRENFEKKRKKKEESYHLMRGLPADRAALLQLKQAWWAWWSGSPAPHHYHPKGLINH